MAEAPTVVDNIQKDMLLKASELHTLSPCTSAFAMAASTDDACQMAVIGGAPLTATCFDGLY